VIDVTCRIRLTTLTVADLDRVLTVDDIMSREASEVWPAASLQRIATGRGRKSRDAGLGNPAVFKKQSAN
jgi:hypothetical protein